MDALRAGRIAAMKSMRLLSCRSVGSLLLVLVAAAVAQQRYPSRPVRVVVAWAPGGAADLTARVVGQKLGEQLGQQLVVDNRPGAIGAIGTHLAAKWTADGGAGSARLGAWMRPGSGL